MQDMFYGLLVEAGDVCIGELVFGGEAVGGLRRTPARKPAAVRAASAGSSEHGDANCRRPYPAVVFRGCREQMLHLLRARRSGRLAKRQRFRKFPEEPIQLILRNQHNGRWRR